MTQAIEPWVILEDRACRELAMRVVHDPLAPVQHVEAAIARLSRPVLDLERLKRGLSALTPAGLAELRRMAAAERARQAELAAED